MFPAQTQALLALTRVIDARYILIWQQHHLVTIGLLRSSTAGLKVQVVEVRTSLAIARVVC
jgi:hypothetical protein